MPSEQHADLAVVGAGIIGLAHALAAAKRGLSVIVFDRNEQAVGASVRNFGLVLIDMKFRSSHAKLFRLSPAIWKPRVAYVS